MKGAAARGPEEGNYQFDQDGYLQRKEDETDEQHVARTAEPSFAKECRRTILPTLCHSMTNRSRRTLR